jgi:hypothetical protein
MKPADPDNLRREERPAVVDVEGQGAVFVALAATKDNGWLRIREWNGTRAKLPPHRVNTVQYLETETDRETLDGARRLADPEWRAEAREFVDDDGEQPVVADD